MKFKTSTLALFDFDGTLTMDDSLKIFMIFTHGRVGFIWCCLLETLTILQWGAHIISRQKAKEILFGRFYKDWPIDRFTKQIDLFHSTRLPSILRSEAIAKLNWHRDKGHRLIVVTASFESILKPFTDKYETELIGTKIKMAEGKISGTFASRNCRGSEKVKRLKNYLDIDNFQEIYAYGDSAGDREMLAIADHPFYKRF